MSKKKAVVALGHDALGSTTLAQLDAVKRTAKALADLVEADYQLTITHSNGHQVSMIHKAMTELRRIYIDYTPAPMCVLCGLRYSKFAEIRAAQSRHLQAGQHDSDAGDRRSLR